MAAAAEVEEEEGLGHDLGLGPGQTTAGAHGPSLGTGPGEHHNLLSSSY